MMTHPSAAPRWVVLILGDQLDRHSAALDGFDPTQDQVLMIESPDEIQRRPAVAGEGGVSGLGDRQPAEWAERGEGSWSHPARAVVFLSAMRHFAQELRAKGWPLRYMGLGEGGLPGDLDQRLARHLQQVGAGRLKMVAAGEWGLQQRIVRLCQQLGVTLDLQPDRHFYVSPAAFQRWAANRASLRMEFFYRALRQKTGILMSGSQPVGGQWNFDRENRGHFGRQGPGWLPAPRAFPPDTLTRQVIDDVQSCLPSLPGQVDDFDWPVTAEEAELALEDFITHRLPAFGEFQDAMWQGEPWLYHARLAAALNLKLISPRRVVDAALAAYQAGRAPLAAVEGFVRQILGWREFIRGVYWRDMPDLAWANHFDHQTPLPAWFWTGSCQMNCLRQVIGQTLRYGYAHHIQRLMVIGNFSLLAGLRPAAVARWFLSVYVDAVEWVELPNVAGMALFANGGRFTSKPYVASGAYIARMSNYCRDCPYAAERRSGPGACPVTAFYWDFIARHETALAANPRTRLMTANLARLGPETVAEIRQTARHLRDALETL